jgi:hypothetical protein
LRVFLDTNVLVAAFATRGLCADVLRLVLVHHELVTSAVVVAELQRALSAWSSAARSGPASTVASRSAVKRGRP